MTLNHLREEGLQGGSRFLLASVTFLHYAASTLTPLCALRPHRHCLTFRFASVSLLQDPALYHLLCPSPSPSALQASPCIVSPRIVSPSMPFALTFGFAIVARLKDAAFYCFCRCQRGIFLERLQISHTLTHANRVSQEVAATTVYILNYKVYLRLSVSGPSVPDYVEPPLFNIFKFEI
jgi:hypothetical protein